METHRYQDLVEIIRLELVRGKCNLDSEGAPCSGYANQIARKLSEEGLFDGPEKLRTYHDAKEEEMKSPDDYQLGYLHGLSSAIVIISTGKGKS